MSCEVINMTGVESRVICADNSHCIQNDDTAYVCLCQDSSFEFNEECYNPSVTTDGKFV